MCDWIKTAKVGDKVELARDISDYAERAMIEGVDLPRRGVVYTIRDMEPGVVNRHSIFIRLQELVNGPHPGDGIEPSFFAGWFRPVQSRPTSIQVFTDMLKTVGKPVTEDA